MKRFALTAIGRDRPGIVAAVTGVLYVHGCNIEDSSMTILEDEFAIILIMSAPDKTDVKKLIRDVKAVEKEMSLAIHLKEIEGKAGGEGRQSNHIITLHGADRTGIIYRTSKLLSGLGINITDLETKIAGGEGKEIYIMVMEVFSPEGLDIGKVEKKLNSLAESMGVTIRIRPIEAYEPL